MVSGKEVIKKKTRKIKHDHFPNLPHVQQLIIFFENLHNDMRVTEVWFLKKRIKVMDLRNSTMTKKTLEVEVMMSLSQ
jgi:hypothetical protein